MEIRGILYTLLFITCFAFQIKASSLDSLSNFIISAPEDTTKVQALTKLGKRLRNGSVDSSIITYRKALELSNKIKWEKGKAVSYIGLALCSNAKSDFSSASEFFYNALSIYDKMHDKNGMSMVYAGLGVLFKNQKELDKALEFLNKALKIDIEIGKKRRIPTHYGNIGVVYKHLQDFEKALEYYFKALEIDKKLHNLNGQSRHLGNIGVIYKNQEKYEEAIEYYFKSLKISEDLNNLEGILIQTINISSLYVILNKYDEAEKYLKRSLYLSQQLEFKEGLLFVYQTYADLYEKMGKSVLALENYKRAMIYKDSIFNEENKKEILRQEVNFEYEKKRAVEQAQHDKELAVAALEQKRQQLFLVFLAVVLLAVMVISFVIYKSLKNSNKQKRLIELQKFEVEQQKLVVDNKNKEITDSITYAKRIQKAILPSNKTVKEYLPNNFVFYLPKDIIAGDFYWLEHKNNKVLFAAADCTGHGVPGAMVSVVCNNALNRTVREYGLTNPAEILNKTREIVVQEFEKSDDDVKDGMDISLCCLDFSESCTTLQWAGANNPLWIIRKNALIEVKPNKQPIGKADNPLPFTTHEIQLQEGDTIYIFTDGFADQFGGKKGKKFMYKPFKELLLSIQDKTMYEQKTVLEKYFENWKGSLEQVDDVCIVGVRV